MFAVWHTYADAEGRHSFKESLEQLDPEARAELLALLKVHRQLSARIDDMASDEWFLDDEPLDSQLRVLRARIETRTCGVIYAFLPEVTTGVREALALVAYVSRRREVPTRLRYLARRRLRSWIRL